MLQAGKNVTMVHDPLQKIQVGQFHHAIVNPKPAIRDNIEQLRNLLTIDPKKYSEQKRKLPYITCGIFNPPYRKTENFASIGLFIIDIDHLSEKGLSADVLKQKLKNDNRIHLMFISPSGDGLKLLFRLSAKCFDHNKYSMFYKVFAQAFSNQYNLNQVIDKRTSDVTRACFISTDPEAYYNPEPEHVDMQAFINFDDPRQMMEIKELEKEQDKSPPKDDTPEPDQSLTDEVLQKIKQKLNPNIRTAKEKNITVPEELNQLLPKIEEHVKTYELTIDDIKNIHYGKQFRFKAGPHFAVINLFYGKNGYKIVKTTKTGSSAKLAELSKQILGELLFADA